MSLNLISYIIISFCTGRDIPNVLMAQDNQTKPIDNSVVPAANEAGRQYEENGGTVQ